MAAIVLPHYIRSFHRVSPLFISFPAKHHLSTCKVSKQKIFFFRPSSFSTASSSSSSLSKSATSTKMDHSESIMSTSYSSRQVTTITSTITEAPSSSSTSSSSSSSWTSEEAGDLLRRIREEHPSVFANAVSNALSQSQHKKQQKQQHNQELFDSSPRPPSRQKASTSLGKGGNISSSGAAGSNSHHSDYLRTLFRFGNIPPSSRGFDMRKYRMRHIALHIAYLGHEYAGFAAQETGGGDLPDVEDEENENVRSSSSSSAAMIVDTKGQKSVTQEQPSTSSDVAENTAADSTPTTTCTDTVTNNTRQQHQQQQHKGQKRPRPVDTTTTNTNNSTTTTTANATTAGTPLPSSSTTTSSSSSSSSRPANPPAGLTVEDVIFAALRKACLIEERDGSGYQRCGRTDRGVSAGGQVISLRVRSRATRFDIAGVGLRSSQALCSFALGDIGNPDTALASMNNNNDDGGRKSKTDSTSTSTTSSSNSNTSTPMDTSTSTTTTTSIPPPSPPSNPLTKSKFPRVWIRHDGVTNTGEPFPEAEEELDYGTILNNVLPPDVRILGWADVPDDFSARFSATCRTYRYYFPRRDLDIQTMRQAAGILVGTHDFRNVCKIDLQNTQNFVREVLSVRIVPANTQSIDEVKEFYDKTNQLPSASLSSSSAAAGAVGAVGSAATSSHDADVSVVTPRYYTQETLGAQRFTSAAIRTHSSSSSVSLASSAASSITTPSPPLVSTASLLATTTPTTTSTKNITSLASLHAQSTAIATKDGAFEMSSRSSASYDPRSLFYIEVVGRAFLWHQIRCVAALLFLVGRRLETVETLQKLLDPVSTPARPLYNMASEAPLILFHCGFGEEEAEEEEEEEEEEEAAVGEEEEKGKENNTMQTLVQREIEGAKKGVPVDSENTTATTSKYKTTFGATSAAFNKKEKVEEELEVVGEEANIAIEAEEDVTTSASTATSTTTTPVAPDAAALSIQRRVRFLRSYPTLHLTWHQSVSSLHHVTQDLERIWSGLTIKAALVKGILDRVGSTPVLERKRVVVVAANGSISAKKKKQKLDDISSDTTTTEDEKKKKKMMMMMKEETTMTTRASTNTNAPITTTCWAQYLDNHSSIAVPTPSSTAVIHKSTAKEDISPNDAIATTTTTTKGNGKKGGGKGTPSSSSSATTTIHVPAYSLADVEFTDGAHMAHSKLVIGPSSSAPGQVGGDATTSGGSSSSGGGLQYTPFFARPTAKSIADRWNDIPMHKRDAIVALHPINAPRLDQEVKDRSKE